MLNLNRITHNPFDEEELFDALLKEYDKDREIIKRNKGKAEDKKEEPNNLDTYCRNHPLIKEHFVYVGGTANIENDDGFLEASLKYQNEFFDKYWKHRGVERPEKEHRCKCTYFPLETNHYIMNTFNHRLLVIGSECIKKFQLRPRCKKCNTIIQNNQAVNCDMLCKECMPYRCKVCKFEIDRTIKSRVCAECSELGRKRVKFGYYQGQSYLTLFKTDKKIVLNMGTRPSTFLGRFQQRIDMYV